MSAIIPPLRSSGSSRSEVPATPSVLLVKRISWPAVAAGTVIALAIEVLLAMLGTGVGASAVDPLAVGESPSAAAFGMGAGIWWAVSSLIAVFSGAWVSGRLSGMQRAADGGLHGVLTWAVAMLATLYLIGSAASSVLSGAAGVLGTAATAGATVGAAAVPKLADAASDQLRTAGISIDSIKQDAMKLLSQTGKPALQPGALEKQAATATTSTTANSTDSSTDTSTDTSTEKGEQDYAALISKLLAGGKDAATQIDRDAVINIVMARAVISREEATQRVQAWENAANTVREKTAQTAEEAKQKAREVGDATARGVSRAMLLAFAVFAIGALIAWWGGSMGQRRSVVAE